MNSTCPYCKQTHDCPDMRAGDSLLAWRPIMSTGPAQSFPGPMIVTVVGGNTSSAGATRIQDKWGRDLCPLCRELLRDGTSIQTGITPDLDVHQRCLEKKSA